MVFVKVYNLVSWFIRTDYHCPQRRLCHCYVAFHTKKYMHKTDLYAAGTHTSESHMLSTVLLSQHQKYVQFQRCIHCMNPTKWS